MKSLKISKRVERKCFIQKSKWQVHEVTDVLMNSTGTPVTMYTYIKSSCRTLCKSHNIVSYASIRLEKKRLRAMNRGLGWTYKFRNRWYKESCWSHRNEWMKIEWDLPNNLEELQHWFLGGRILAYKRDSETAIRALGGWLGDWGPEAKGRRLCKEDSN